MSLLLSQILSFLPWCMVVNVSLNIFGFVASRWPSLKAIDRPADFGIVLPDGERVFGNGRTVGGILLCVFLGIAGEAFFPGHNLLLFALLVVVGDMAGSFIKRRLGMACGEFLPFVDHGDYVIVTGGVLWLMGAISLPAWALSYVLVLVLTPPVTWSAHALRLRESAL